MEQVPGVETRHFPIFHECHGVYALEPQQVVTDRFSMLPDGRMNQANLTVTRRHCFDHFYDQDKQEVLQELVLRCPKGVKEGGTSMDDVINNMTIPLFDAACCSVLQDNNSLCFCDRTGFNLTLESGIRDHASNSILYSSICTFSLI